MSETCADIVCAVLLQLFFLFFIIPIGLVAATHGAIAGAVIGWKTDKTRFMQNVTMGAVSWTTLSLKLTRATFDYLISDGDHERRLAVKLVKVIPGFPVLSKFARQMKEGWKISLKEEMKKYKRTCLQKISLKEEMKKYKRTCLQLIKNGFDNAFSFKRYKNNVPNVKH